MAQHSGVIGITMGDPAGVGPEIICKALAEMPASERRTVRVFGNRQNLEAAAKIVGTPLRFADAATDDLTVEIEDVPVEGGQIPFGKVDPRGGEACFQFIASAVRAAQAGEIGCIVTAPINKEALNLAGHHYDGHTGMLAHLTGSRSSWMLLASERMNVIHVSTHVSLTDAIARVRPERIVETIRTGYEYFRRIGNPSPRIAVAGLNPHCGENGLFGKEDDLYIAPAVAAARAEGIDVVGPVSPDTVFHRAYNGAFDLVVAQYHDQGHIPMKLVAFDHGVNISLGLPIDRTSVDHGTAFDIAGTGKANHVNMNAAIAAGRKLANSPRSAS